MGCHRDFVAWFDYISRSGIVGVNHEYTNPALMFPNYDPDQSNQRQVDHEIAAHGESMLLVARYSGSDGSGYRHYRGSSFDGRIHGASPIAISGPAAGHVLLRTSTAQDGASAHGTFNDCGGGVTPWGTDLTAEENFDQSFGNNKGVSNEMAMAANTRFGVREEGGRRPWC